MESSVLLVIFSMLCFTFLIIGGIIGWLAQQNNYVNMQHRQDAFATHPEMYDENGMLIADEIVALRFENPNDTSETEDDSDED